MNAWVGYGVFALIGRQHHLPGATMNMKHLAAAALTLCAVTAAHAARIDLQIAGTVILGSAPGAPIGTPVTGLLSYDSESTPMSIFGPSQVLYYFPPPYTFEVHAGDMHVTSEGLGAFISHIAGGETLQFVGSGIQVNGVESEGARLIIGLGNEVAGSLVPGGPFPTGFNVADFETHTGLFVPGGQAEPTFAFDLTSISAVPEPSSLAIALSGLMVAGALIKRRQGALNSRPAEQLPMS
jgi:hypothetical protein